MRKYLLNIGVLDYSPKKDGLKRVFKVDCCRLRWNLLFLSGIAGSAFAVMPAYDIPDAPWMTGTLLSPSGRVTKGGHVGFEQYCYLNSADSKYDSDWKKIESQRSIWDATLESSLTVGLTGWAECYLNSFWHYTSVGGAQSYELGDAKFGIGIQLVEESQEDYWPSIKLTIAETFPTGKYDFFDPQALGSDAGGFGRYSTKAQLAISRLIRLSGIYWLNLRLAANYNFPASTHVQGLNTFGGALDTDGWISQGQWMEAFFGLQLTLAQRWTFSFDALAIYEKPIRFKGYPGFIAPNVPAVFPHHCSASYSIAPALEYNWSQQVGIIGGVWFSIAGKNSLAFTNGVIALNFSY